MSVVVDANVLVALLVADEHQPAAQAHLEAWLVAGEDLHAPGVLPYEIANVLSRLVFEGALNISEVTEIWQDFAAFGLYLHQFDLADDGPQIVAITDRLRRWHATDSTYVRLAQRLKTTLWTLDGALARNAAAAGFSVRQQA